MFPVVSEQRTRCPYIDAVTIFLQQSLRCYVTLHRWIQTLQDVSLNALILISKNLDYTKATSTEVALVFSWVMLLKIVVHEKQQIDNWQD